MAPARCCWCRFTRRVKGGVCRLARAMASASAGQSCCQRLNSQSGRLSWMLGLASATASSIVSLLALRRMALLSPVIKRAQVTAHAEADIAHQAAVGALQGKVTQHFAQAFPVAFTGQYPVEDTYRGQARVRRCQWSHPAVRLPGTDPGYRAADRPRPCAACRAVAVLQESVRHRRWPHGCRCRPR